MSRFVEESIVAAGLGPVLAAHRSGDREALGAAMAPVRAADLMVLGALADLVRSEDTGETVYVHERYGRGGPSLSEVTWIQSETGVSELDVLRAVATARMNATKGARIGIDWSQCGIELAQVALGFGATDLQGPMMRKSGLPIYEDETQKVKGQGMVELRSIRRREIAALVMHAGRVPVFVDEHALRPHDPAREVAHNA